jgi:hypothetical protein
MEFLKQKKEILFFEEIYKSTMENTRNLHGIYVKKNMEFPKKKKDNPFF